MKLIDIYEKDELEAYIQYAIELRRAQQGRINEMLNIEYLCCDMKEQTVTFAFPVEEWQLNPNGVLHGGISATMMDLALGLFANCICKKVGGVFSPTVNLNMNYLLPVPANDTVVITGRLVSSGRSLLTLEGHLKVRSSGELAVTASGSFKVLRK